MTITLNEVLMLIQQYNNTIPNGANHRVFVADGSEFYLRSVDGDTTEFRSKSLGEMASKLVNAIGIR